MGAQVVTVNDVLDGHVALDIQCLDRIYLNAYVPRLQTSAQVVAFLSGHLGYPFPSPALFNQIGQRFRRAVACYAEANDIPWVQFGKDDDKLAVMRAHLDRQAATGTSGVAAIGVDSSNLVALIDANEGAIEAAGVVQHSYTAPGDGHGIFEYPKFYELEVKGEKLVDWVARLIEG